MPKKELKSKLSCTTGKGYFYKGSSPKFKYIQDPSDYVDNNYKNDYSQYLVPYDVLAVNVIPIWGPYSGQRIILQYDWDSVQLSINGQENKSDVIQLKPGTSPDSFIRFALDVVHSPRSRQTSDRDVCSTNQRIYQPTSLVVHCLRSAITHIRDMPDSLVSYLPQDFLGYFNKESQIQVHLNIWPSCTELPRQTLVVAHRDMVIGEFIWLVRYILKLDNQIKVKLFRRFLPLDSQDVLSENDVIDCVIKKDMFRSPSELASQNKKFVLTKIGPTKYEISKKEVLVVSLIGKGVKEICLSIRENLSTLDQAIRQVYRLGQSTLLSFKHPVQEKFLLRTGKVIKSQMDETKLKSLIANKRRNFPTYGATGIPVKRLYKDSPIYLKSLKSLGFFSGCFVEVFEVTGPTIPVMLFGDVIEPCAVDVNPTWCLEIFLYYLKIFCGRGERFTNIDYVRFIDDKSVRDILDMMGTLWWKVKQTSKAEGERLEYLKVRA